MDYAWEASMEQWREARQAQIATIDFIAKSFPQRLVDAARLRAAREPHPFWRAYIAQAQHRAENNGESWA